MSKSVNILPPTKSRPLSAIDGENLYICGTSELAMHDKSRGRFQDFKFGWLLFGARFCFPNLDE